MEQTKEVETSIGLFIVKKPKAGVRNKAMIKAETPTGFKQTTLMFELLPKCIAKRPADIDQDVPIVQILDDLETDDYDALVTALRDMINPSGEGIEAEVNEVKN